MGGRREEEGKGKGGRRGGGFRGDRRPCLSLRAAIRANNTDNNVDDSSYSGRTC